jgi:hypothetical protein
MWMLKLETSISNKKEKCNVNNITKKMCIPAEKENEDWLIGRYIVVEKFKQWNNAHAHPQLQISLGIAIYMLQFCSHLKV